MSTAIQELLSQSLETQPEMEALSDYFGMVRRVAERWTGEVHDLVSNLRAPDHRLVMKPGMGKAVNKAPFSAWGKILGECPAGLDDNLLPFILHLGKTIEVLGDVHKRLYTPLTDYIQRQIAIPEERDKIWSDRNLVMVDIEIIKKDMKSFFDPKMGEQRGNTSAPINTMFSGERDFMACADAIRRIQRQIEDLDLRNIRDQEERLHETIMLYTKSLHNGDAEQTNNVNNIRRFEQAVFHAAEETELLSSSIYFFMTAMTAYEETCSILERALEV